MADRPLRVRFAPSPTGMFHVGSARSALFNWIIAKQAGGTFILRIEDTDTERNRPEWTQGIIDAMAWLGMSAEDPIFEGPTFQSANADAHLAAALRLFAEGRAYYCDCTRDVLEARTGDPHKGYDKFCRDRGLEAGPGRALRFRVPEGTTVVEDLIRGSVAFDNGTIEDFVVLRGNGSPLFLIANVVDDVDQRISLVVRGEEHFPNTPKQQLLWEALGVVPPTWAHVPVLVNEQRKKLSKRRDKVALEQFRDEGYVMPAMRNYLMTLGWAPAGDQEIVPWERIVSEFHIDDVISSPAFFDLKKLASFNGEYLRAMSASEFGEAAQPWVEAWLAAHPEAAFDEQVYGAMIEHVKTRVVLLAEVPALVDFLFLPSPEIDPASWDKAMKDPAAALLADVVAEYRTVAWDAEALKDALLRIGEAHGQKLGKAQAPVRVAVTGRTVGPPLFEALELLGRDETIIRIEAALKELGGE
jgi:glutamyl-tRNA synthetase